MKKISLLFVMLMMTFISVNAQFSENFDACATDALPVGWTIFNVDGLTPAASVASIDKAWDVNGFTVFPSKAAYSTSWYSPAGAADDWMFTPAITVPAQYAVLKYQVNAPDASFPDGYELRVMTVAPTAGNLMTSTVIYSETAAPSVVTDRIVDLAAYAGQTIYIGWRNNSNDMFILGVDNIEVTTAQPNDAAVWSINNNPMITAGSQNITGTMKNAGGGAITSYDVTYKVNGGTASAVFAVTGQNIAAGATHNFTHNVPFNFTVGSHTVEVTISNVNGGTDPVLTNNVMTKTINVGSQQVAKMCLFEGFSSSTCGPCVSWNTTFNPWATTNDANMNYIKYQMNWPGSGDPYYTEEGGTRRDYYGVNAVPDTYGDGVVLSALSTAALNDAVTAATAKKSFFNIGAIATYTGTTVNVALTINPYIGGAAKVHTAIVEKKTTQNTGSNGETEFHHVMMKMLPTADGASVTFVDGTAYTNTLTHNMSTTFVEGMDDLIAVVFIQDDASKEVLQSKTFPITLLGGVEEDANNNISIFPNPAKDNVNIKNAANADVTVYDLLGKVVLSESNISNNHNLNVAGLAKGNYLVKVVNNGEVTCKKIAIVK